MSTNSGLNEELCVGFTQKAIGFVNFLELPTTRKLYNAPLTIYCWFWFLAYIINYKDRHNNTAFRQLPKSLLFQTLRKNYGASVAVLENFIGVFFSHNLFTVRYTIRQGFHLVTKTTGWFELICSLSGECYSMPDFVVTALDEMGCHYFHDNGLLIGPIALLNHQCNCDISYGFDWQRLKKKKSRCSLYRVTDIVPVYLSYDRALEFPDAKLLLKKDTEIVVKYFESDSLLTFRNLKAWFAGKCKCSNCCSRSSAPTDDFPISAVKLTTLSTMPDIDLDVGAISGDQSVETSHLTSVSKRLKTKALNKTVSLYSKKAKIVDRPRKTRVVTEIVHEQFKDPYDEWVGEYVMSKKRMKRNNY